MRVLTLFTSGYSPAHSLITSPISNTYVAIIDFLRKQNLWNDITLKHPGAEWLNRGVIKKDTIKGNPSEE